MYKSFSASVLKQMEERAEIMVTVKEGWTSITKWSSTPGFISYCLGVNREQIFSCYITREESIFQISCVEPTELIKGQKSLVDAYIYVALRGLIKFANNMGVRQLVFDSYIPAAADHMLDMGFVLTPRGIPGSRGCKILED